MLLGKTEPTGRLVTTFPVADGDGPAWIVTPENGSRIHRRHGRWLSRLGRIGVEPAFWFGSGLGCGAWNYRSAEHRRAGGRESVVVVLSNSAARPSTEVVQVYWRPEGSAPVRLVGYAIADEVVTGEERVITVDLDRRALRLWDESAGTCTFPAGGTLLVARGLGDIRLEIPRRNARHS